MFNKDTEIFQSTIQNARVSGCTTRLSQSVVQNCTNCGTLFHKIKNFSDRILVNGSTVPEKVTLAHALRSVLLSIEEHLSTSISEVQSLLQLQQLLAKPRQLLLLLRNTIEDAEKSKYGEELLSTMFKTAQELSEKGSWLADCTFDMFRSVCDPFLNTIEQCIGLKQSSRGNIIEIHALPMPRDSHLGQSVTRPGNVQTGRFFDGNKSPNFIAPEDTKAIIETGKAFRILQIQHPTHPLCVHSNQSKEFLGLHLTSNLKHVQYIITKARDYEAQLKAAIREFDEGYFPNGLVQTERSTSDDNVDPWSLDSDASNHWLTDRLANLDELRLMHIQGSPNQLEETTRRALAKKCRNADTARVAMEDIPLALAPSLSLNPYIHAQAHLVHATTLRLLFHSHQLRSHVSILRAYHLLGHGSFLFGLTNALFSPDLASAERRKGMPRIGQKMGLQLGHRATWPPASAELRLALMGILSESYHSLAKYKQMPLMSRIVKDRDLPGGLSFAVRQLSEDEIEKCVQPNSLHALDFLRIQYTPPQPLDAVVTPTSLQRYDAIFTFLLRLVRMQWVITQQCSPLASSVDRRSRNGPRQAHDDIAVRFRFEARHFISTLASYFFDVAVSGPCRLFDAYLHRLEKCFGNADYLDRGNTLETSLSMVREAHESMLATIMTSLYLQKEQMQTRLALEKVFGIILHFTSLQGDGTHEKVHAQTPELYSDLRTSIQEFLHASSRVEKKDRIMEPRVEKSAECFASLHLLFE